MRIALILILTLAAPALCAAAESFTTALPSPPEGKAVVQVICRQSPAGLMSDCRGLRVLPLGFPVMLDAEAKVNGTIQPVGPTPGSALKTVEIDLPSGPLPTSNPVGVDWLSKPTPAQIAAAYPQRALGDHIAGLVVLSCRVTPRGVVNACLVASESPKGEGFGQAALRLASQFSIKRADDGAVGGTIVIPLSFAP